jgi:hypothetical protein
MDNLLQGILLSFEHGKSREAHQAIKLQHKVMIIL